MLYPGAVVDILSTVSSKRAVDERTILQGIKVLAVNGAVDGTTFVRVTRSAKKMQAAARWRRYFSLTKRNCSLWPHGSAKLISYSVVHPMAQPSNLKVST